MNGERERDKPVFPLSATSGKNNGLSTELFDIALSVDWTRADSDAGFFGKRKLGRRDSVGSDDEDSVISAPANDIYRKRQQKKIR
jgi:hypothetical protein